MNLGAQARQKDKRDFKLGAYQAPVEIPESYSTDISKVKHLFQNGWPACGAHAGAHFKEVQDGVDLSPDFLWQGIKAIDIFRPEDGTSMPFIFKSLQNRGVCRYELLPNDYSKDLTAYTHPQINDEMLGDAKAHGIGNYAFHDFPTVQEVKQAIFQNKVVIFLLWVDNGFFHTHKPTFTQKLYGHFVIGYGYDKDKILILDSTEENTTLSTKEIPVSAIGFIRELGTALDLPDRYIFKNFMGITQKSEDVKQLQLRLGVNPTGYFGPLTLAAVIKYQLSKKITPTGYVGNLTIAALNT